MPEVIYLNGRFVSPSEAVVSIHDRGFTFGDAVYEVLRSYDGRLWAFERHMRRLRRSLDAIDLQAASVDEIGAAITRAYEVSEFPNALVYLQVTRGVAPRRHRYTRDLQPTVVITVRDITPMIADVDFNGVAGVTAPDLRWRRCDIKSTNLLANVLAKTHAHDQSAHEAILVDADGCITEGTSTSVFWVRDGTLCTRPTGPEVLPGVSGGMVLESAADVGIPARKEHIPLEQFRRCDEIFLAGTGHEVCPVTTLDGERVGDARPGPISLRLLEAYRGRVGAQDDAPR